jgi:hypothetical protein
MDQPFRQLISRLDRIEARRAAMATRLPEWAQDHQGAMMACVMLRKLGGRVSQATSPDWYEPAELLPEGTKAMGRLALSML